MSGPRTFRFGVVAPAAGSAREWAALAQRVESLGYTTLAVPDTIGPTLSVIPALAAAAAATSTLRVASYVLANDYRNPVLLAREAATLDLLSDGRLELGIGAGRPTAGDDYRKLGLSLESGGVRVTRLTESLSILAAMLAGEVAGSPGSHYPIAGADGFPSSTQRPRLPLLVAGTGHRLLTIAGERADIVAIGAPPQETEADVRERIGWVREGAGARFPSVELNLNLFSIGEVNDALARRMGLDPAQLAASGSPAILLGGPEAMAEELTRRRESLGVAYFMVPRQSLEAFAPVVKRLAGT